MLKYLSRLFSGLALLLLGAGICLAQSDPAHQARGGNPTPGPHYRIHYLLDLTHPANHLFGVTIEVGNVAVPELHFQMPVWYPGRYSVYNFAVNVQNVSATCSTGSALPVRRPDSTNWFVTTEGCPTVELHYRVYGNTLTGSFSQLDGTHANVNGGSVFMYIPHHQGDACSLDVSAPGGWKVLDSLGVLNQTHITAPNYDILIDSPLEAAPDFTLDSFQEDGKTYRVMIHSYLPVGNMRGKLISALKKIVKTENRVVAPTDLNTYTFFFHFDPQSPGDGMEHLYGTQIIMPFGLESPDGLHLTLEDAAHEFFHQWNVKRIRPVGLGPFNYTHVPQTPLLWVAEGWTQYYGVISIERAGLQSPADLLKSLGRTISYFESQPGHLLMSAEASSLTADYHDRSPLFQETNQRATTISYYFKGELLAMMLDLDLRHRSGGRRDLDDVLRWLWQHNYEGRTDSYYLPGHGYTEADVEHAVEAVGGVSYADFFRDYVRGVKELPYDQYLGYAGLELACRVPDGVRSYSGLELMGDKVVMVAPGSPASLATFGNDDVIKSVNGAAANGGAAGLLRALAPGQAASVVVERHLQMVTLHLTPALPHASQCSVVELPHATPQEKKLRKQWLKDDVSR